MKDKAPTRYPGVFRLDQANYWIRAKVVDPRTGKNREIDRILEETVDNDRLTEE